MKHCNTVPHFWVFGLPSIENSCPNAIYFVRDGDLISMYTTDSNGIPFMVGSANPSGNITLTSPNNTITISNSGEDFTIDISSTLINLIDNLSQSVISLQANKFDNPTGDNTEYLDGAGVPTPFPTPTGNTNLGYTASPINGVVTSNTGTDATIPLANNTNAGLLTPSEKGNIASAVQPGDLATVATSGSYNDLADQPAIPDPTDFLKLDGTSIMEVGASVNFANGSKVGEGAVDAGTGGNKGVALICAVGYEWKFEAGEAYLTRLSDNKIQVKEYSRSAPTVTDDSSKGYENGSVWNMVDHNEAYLCIDPAVGAATWQLKEYTFDPATVDTNYVRNGISGWVEGYSKTQTDTLLDGKVDENSSITGATKTKITYDSKGLVTFGEDSTKSDVGLGNVDNTSDLDKPVSTAQQTAIDALKPVGGLIFSGTFALDSTGGKVYNNYTQTGNLTLATSSPTLLGNAEALIIANGSTLAAGAGWVNIGSESLSAVNGAVNRVWVYYNGIETRYTVKVN